MERLTKAVSRSASITRFTVAKDAEPDSVFFLFRVVNATDKACGSGQTVLRTMVCTIMTYDMGASTFFCFFSLSFCHFFCLFPDSALTRGLE